MGPKFYACVAMSHDKKCLCRMIRISKLCPSHVMSGVSPLILPPCRSCRFLPMYTPFSSTVILTGLSCGDLFRPTTLSFLKPNLPYNYNRVLGRCV